MKFREVKSGYIVLDDCIFCGKSKKLYVNISNKDRPHGFTKCQSCGITGLFNKIIKIVDNTNDLEAYRKFNDNIAIKREVSPEIEILNKLSNLEIITESVSDRINKFDFIRSAEIILPTKIKDQSEGYLNSLKKGEEYLKSRGFNDEDIRKSEVVIYPADHSFLKKIFISEQSEEDKTLLRSAISKKMQAQDSILLPQEQHIYDEYSKLYKLFGRVVFPVKVGKKTIGYVARDYTGLVPKDNKVLNSTGPLSSEFFWNFNNVNKSEKIIILEGIFSANTCGINRSVATLGMNNINNKNKLNLFKSIQPKEFVIFFDPGAIEKSAELALELSKSESIVKIVIPPTIIKIKDPIEEGVLRELGISITKVDANGLYYISYSDYSLIKMSSRSLKALKTKGLAAEKIIHEIIDRMKDKFPERRKKFYYLNNKAKADENYKEAFDKIAESGFLDANDLGREYCDFLIDSAVTFNHFTDYSIYDDLIVKYLTKKEREDYANNEFVDIFIEEKGSAA